MLIEDFKFTGPQGMTLSGRIYRKDNDYRNGVIFSHGLFSSKDGYKITRMAESIAETGFILMTFDFRFAGENSDKISEISILDEVEDLKYAVNFFKEKGINKLHLMGSSLGAAVSILAASKLKYRIDSVILIATPLDFSGIFPGINPDEVKNFDENGFFEVTGIKLKNRFLKELFSLNMACAVQEIKCPALLIHGKKDQVVDFSNLEMYKKNTTYPCTSLIFDDGDHHLTRDDDIKKISEKVNWWLGKYKL